MSSYKKHIKQALLLTIILLLFNAALIYAIDPYQLFHDHWFAKPKYYSNLRVQAPGITRSQMNENGNYDSLIIGTSLAQNFIASEAARAIGSAGCLQLSIAGSSPREQNYVLRTAIKTGYLRKVIILLDSSYLNNDTDYLAQTDFPTYLYSEFPFQYLLSIDSISSTLKLFLGKSFWKDHYNNLGNWMKRKSNQFAEYNSPQNLSALKRQANQVLQTAPPSPVALQKDFKSIDEYILQTADNNPDIQFILIFPPLSTLMFQIHPDMMQNLMSMNLYVVQEADKRQNMSVYGFQDLFGITNNLANYMDGSHYNATVNSLMLRRIAGNLNRVTSANWPMYENAILKNASSYSLYSNPEVTEQ